MASEPVGTGSRYLHGSGSRFIQPNNDDYYRACKKYLDLAGLPDAYEVPSSDLPGSQRATYTVNSVENTENRGDGPGALDYDMDGSLLSYSPLKVFIKFSFHFQECYGDFLSLSSGRLRLKTGSYD